MSINSAAGLPRFNLSKRNVLLITVIALVAVGAIMAAGFASFAATTTSTNTPSVTGSSSSGVVSTAGHTCNMTSYAGG